MNESEARRERERMVRKSKSSPGSPDAPAGLDRATGIDDPTPRAEYRDEPPEHDPREQEPANPQSGYDDTIWVVVQHPSTRDGVRHPICAYRSEEKAREVAEEKTEAFTHYSVSCVGLHHE